VDADLQNETWIIDRGGSVAERLSDAADQSITDLDRVIYCLWVTDYGMRNAGDLETAADLYPAFQSEGAARARALGLAKTQGLFLLPITELEEKYFELLGDVCAELQAADALSPNTSFERTREG
jgi:hypothetical protein